MGTCSTENSHKNTQNRSEKDSFFTRNYPVEFQNTDVLEICSHSFFFFICFISQFRDGRSRGFRAQTKRETSLYPNKTNPGFFFGPVGISLRASNSSSSSCPFWPSAPSFRTPPSQSPRLPDLYVSASGMWCDTCYLWIPACPVALFAPPPSITHACVAFQGRGAGARVGGGCPLPPPPAPCPLC